LVRLLRPGSDDGGFAVLGEVFVQRRKEVFGQFAFGPERAAGGVPGLAGLELWHDLFLAL
jgi:hypothetical protein